MSRYYSKSKSGWYRIDGKKYYLRSSWEVNYARYLQWLKEQKKIKRWKYEPKTFWFENIKRGVRSYKPDFEVVNNDNKIEYYEVKGYMDSKSKTKIKRMKKYYPEVKLNVVQKDEYNTIKKWEKLFPTAIKVEKSKRSNIK
jgi:hypothetical protein